MSQTYPDWLLENSDNEYKSLNVESSDYIPSHVVIDLSSLCDDDKAMFAEYLRIHRLEPSTAALKLVIYGLDMSFS